MEASPQPIPLQPSLLALAGYLVLQVLINLVLSAVLRRRGMKPGELLVSTFWASVANAVYFLVAAILLHINGYAPNRDEPRSDYLLLALLGIPLGPLLWYLAVMGRKLGNALFGRSGLVAAEDAILSVPPQPRYIGWGVINLAVIQPLGRETFFRGALLPTIGISFGWPMAITATLVIELLLRLNISWFFQVAVYVLCVSGLYIVTGTALTGLVAASVAGLLQAVVLLRVAGRARDAQAETILGGNGTAD